MKKYLEEEEEIEGLPNYEKRYKALVRYAKEQGLRVLVKPYSILMDYAAMNPDASKEMHWGCPEGQIWICKEKTWKDKFLDLRHELQEMYEMERNGMEYGPAHKAAMRDEKKRIVPLYCK